jgi:hypothetical protein
MPFDSSGFNHEPSPMWGRKEESPYSLLTAVVVLFLDFVFWCALIYVVAYMLF